jgi:hypothetical protein
MKKGKGKQRRRGEIPKQGRKRIKGVARKRTPKRREELNKEENSDI